MTDVNIPLDVLDDLSILLTTCQNYFEAMDIAEAHRSGQEDVKYSPLSKEILQTRTRIEGYIKDHLYENRHSESDEEEEVDEEELDTSPEGEV